MTDDPSATDPTASHADAPGSGDATHADTDAHEHAEEPLGPIDVWAWGASALGVLLGLATIVCFALATGVVSVA